MTRKIATVAIAAITLTLNLILPPAMGGDYYEGRAVRLIVMTSPGGGYDTYARAIARHLGKHLPGKPKIIVQNMPGAGGLLATNYLYNIAKPDGLTIGMINSGAILWQAVGVEEIRYDSRRFTWIGAPGEALPVCAIMGFTGLRTLDQILKSNKTLNFGSAGTSTYQQPMLLKLLLHANISVVKGYSGTSSIRSAMQRREVDGGCWQWDSMKITAREMLDVTGDDKLIPFIIEGESDDPEVKNLPQYSRVVKAQEDLSLIDAWLTQYRVYRPLVAPPNSPESLVQMLRAALKNTLRDPVFQAQASKMQLDIKHVPGEKIEEFVKRTLSISRGIKEKLRPIVVR